MNTESQIIRFVFSEDTGADFLQRVEIPGLKNEEKVLEAWDEMKRSRRKPLRALFIFLLLAKHRCELWKRQSIRFDDKATVEQIEKESDQTWIYSLAVLYKEWQQETGRIDKALKIKPKGELLFQNELFFKAMLRRPMKKGANRVGKTYAAYFVEKLIRVRLEFVIVNSANTKDFETLEGERLAEHALKLELYEIQNRKRALEVGKKKPREGWLPLAERLVAETKNLCPPADETHLVSRWSCYPPSKPIILQSQIAECWALKGDVGEALKRRMENPRPLEKWYIVSIGPALPVGPVLRSVMTYYLSQAVISHDVSIYWAFQSAAGKKCKAIAAQWKANTDPGDSMAELISEMEIGIKEGKKALGSDFEKCWEIEIKRSGKRLRFYESHIVHNFSAILFVPREFPPTNQDDPPHGTACYVIPFPMVGIRRAMRCALYLEGASQIMRFYYSAVRGFFDDGVENGNLSPIDPSLPFRRQRLLSRKSALRKQPPSNGID